MGELSHVTAAGDVRMVDVGAKPLSRRRAVARATVRMASGTLRQLRDLPKGDALTTAQLAGIMAAKRTPDIVPLCHPLPLTMVDVEPVLDDEGVTVTAAAETTAQTGVEMEALSAVAAAALTVYDMTKGLDPNSSIEHICLVEKSGGKSGDWRREARWSEPFSDSRDDA